MINYYPPQFHGIRSLSGSINKPCPKPPFGVGSTYKGKYTYVIAQESNLGKGTFGYVKMVKEQKSGKLFAMKIINKDKVAKLSAEEYIKREITLQTKLTHNNILKLHEYFEDKNDIFLILELCVKGNLYQLLKQKKKLSEAQAFSFGVPSHPGDRASRPQSMFGIIRKPENILFFDETLVKICDYNWAKKLEPGDKCDPVICGTTEYMPPEVVMKQPHDQLVDVWSLGIMLFEFFHGDIPFKGATQKEKINAILGNSLQLNNDLPLDLQILIRQMLNRQTDQRPNVKQVLQSKWVTRMKIDYASGSRPQTTYTKTRGLQSQRLSFFSNNSQKTTSTGISRKKESSPVSPEPRQFDQNFQDLEQKFKQQSPIRVVTVKAQGAPSITPAFGTDSPAKRATSYQPNRTPTKI